MTPLDRFGCPELGSKEWARWFDEHGLGWFGRSSPEAYSVGEAVAEPTLQSALSARHPARATRKRETQQKIADHLARALDELWSPPSAPPTRAHPLAQRVQERAVEARNRIRAWQRGGRTTITADAATGEVRASLGVLACDGVRGLVRYDGRSGDPLGDTCDHEGPCGARVLADELFAAWLDEPGSASFRAAAGSPVWERALAELQGLAGSQAVRVRLSCRPEVRAELVDARGHVLPAHERDRHPRARQLGSAAPAEVLRAASQETSVDCDGARVRVFEVDLPVTVTPAEGGARLGLPPEVDGSDAIWFLPAPPGELRWAERTDLHRRLLRWTDTVFPTAELGALLARLRALPLQVTVAPGTLGTPIAWDGRLAIELSFGPGGLVGTVAVALPGGATCPPGAGPLALSCQDGATRWEVQRDAAAELRAVESLWTALDLRRFPHPDSPFGFVVPALPEVVRLATALRANPALVLTWRRPLTIVTLAPERVELSLRPAGAWYTVDGWADEELVPLDRLLQAIRDRQQVLEVAPGELLHLSEPLFRRLGRLADAAETTRDGTRVGRVHARAFDEDLAARLGAAPEDVTEVPVPAGLRAELRDYQREGLTFLARRAAWAPGAVLADDMGLGKTLQALALVVHRGGPTLVVGPTSVLPNWLAEATRFAPGLTTVLHHGARNSQPAPGPDTLVVTSWDVLVRDEAALAAIPWRTVVFDEAHAVKNPRTRRAQAASALQAGFRVGLTGTPVENHLGELWSLLAVVVPGLLPAEETFRARFSGPIERGEPERLDRLRALVHPFLLRRTKAQVARELPSRTEVVHHVALTKQDRVSYDRLRRSAAAHWGRGEGRDRFALLAALTRLRQLACDARLVEPGARPGAKLEHLVELVQEAVREGQRTLVFSEFTSLLDLAEAALAACSVVTLRLDGSTSLTERRARVEAFQRGAADVFLLSRKAGGTGLNLTAATVVVHLDPWWNPAAEDQATDRAHRIGQQNPVTVIRLVATDTLEERVLSLHADKRAMVAGVLDGAGHAVLAAEELLALLRDEQPEGSAG
jgi:superfamily II DNA or RNA helicase